MDGVRVFHDERVGYRWLDSDALDIWCQEEPTLRTSRQIWADFEKLGCSVAYVFTGPLLGSYYSTVDDINPALPTIRNTP